MAGFRERDMKVERELAKFMDSHLYNDGRFSKHERTDDRDSQLAGSDIILSIPSLGLSDIIVDEKGMTQYMTRPLPTFSLELSFMRYEEQITGWFVDDEKTTQYYLMIWPKATVDWNASENDFIEAEYMLVPKKSLRDYFENEGLSKEALIAKSNEIRRAGVTGQIDKVEGKEYWFFLTPKDKLPEQPINLIVRKNIYRSLSVMSGTIKR